MTAATKTKPVEPTPAEPTEEDTSTVSFGGLTFVKADVPVVSIAGPKTNPYIEAVKSLVGTEQALTFLHTVSERGVRQDFDKIKRELQAAGSVNDTTVRTFIFDNDTGYKLVLPAEKQAKLKLSVPDGDDITDLTKVTTLRVTFWTAIKIVREPATGAGNTPGMSATPAAK